MATPAVLGPVPGSGKQITRILVMVLNCMFLVSFVPLKGGWAFPAAWFFGSSLLMLSVVVEAQMWWCCFL